MLYHNTMQTLSLVVESFLFIFFKTIWKSGLTLQSKISVNGNLSLSGITEYVSVVVLNSIWALALFEG